jgi:hypothetical protein
MAGSACQAFRMSSTYSAGTAASVSSISLGTGGRALSRITATAMAAGLHRRYQHHHHHHAHAPLCHTTAAHLPRETTTTTTTTIRTYVMP